MISEFVLLYRESNNNQKFFLINYVTIISKNKSTKRRITKHLLIKKERKKRNKNERIWRIFIDQNVFFLSHRTFIIFDLFYYFDVSLHIDDAKVFRWHEMTSIFWWRDLSMTRSNVDSPWSKDEWDIRHKK